MVDAGRSAAKAGRARSKRGIAGVAVFWAAACSVLLLVCTLAGFFGHHGVVLDILSSFRLQYLVGALVCAAVLVLVTSYRWAGLAALVIVVNGIGVLPWSFGAPSSVPRRPSLDVLCANVQMENPDYGAIVELVRGRSPDVVALIEVDQAWVQGVSALTQTHPHVLLEPRPDRFGMAIYSRVPLDGSEVLLLGTRGTPTLLTRIRASGRTLSLVVTHPPPPVGSGLFADRNAELVALSERVARLEGPVVLVGDLNTTMWSPHYDHFVETSGLSAARQGLGTLGTWPASLPWPLRVPIDHALVSEDLRAVDLRAGPSMGSDHLPLQLTVSLAE